MAWQQLVDHQTLKQIHIACVVLSISGFLLRAGLMLRDSPLIYDRRTRTLPHLIDSTLFFSGLWMAANLQQYPFTTPWLTAKFLALVGYVLFGAYALRYGRTRTHRIAALLGALLCVGYMITLAIYRSPWPL